MCYTTRIPKGVVDCGVQSSAECLSSAVTSEVFGARALMMYSILYYTVCYYNIL